MNMEDKKFTRLTLEQADCKIVYELPYEDVTNNDMIQALVTIMTGMTFLPATIEDGFVNYINENSDYYEVIAKNIEESSDDK